MGLRLPCLEFSLPKWKPKDFAVLQRCKEKMQFVAGKTGKGSERFKQACKRLWQLAMAGEGKNIPIEIKSAIDVRALTHLLGKNKEFFDNVPVTVELLDSLYKPKPKLGRLSLIQLINVYFVYFDQIGEKAIFNRLCDLICLEIAQNYRELEDGNFSRLDKNRGILFTIHGPKNVVSYAKENGLDLDQAIKKLALDGCNEGRFHKVARYHYYLDTIDSLAIGEDHPVLAEICKPEVCNAPAEDGRLMGHEILARLIDRALPSDISDAWRRVIITIAGDPRVPQAHQRYQKWWTFLGEERICKVRGWLSRLDLLLFLGILQEYGESTGNEEIKRMFPARKAFLEGLYHQQLISGTRLFVGKDAEKYLKKTFNKKELPEYAIVKDSYRSMIYLQVGDVHIVEGSHSFKLWIFPGMPIKNSIVSYSVKEFSPKELGADLESYFKKEFPYEKHKVLSIIHNPNITWQFKAIEHLKKLGVRLDVEELFCREDYMNYKLRYGL